MISYDFLYRYTRPINPRTNKPGTRYDLASREGSGDYPPLDDLRLKRCGSQIIYLHKARYKKGTAPNERSPKNKLFFDRKTISGLFETRADHPGHCYGDIIINGEKSGKDAILTYQNEEKTILEIGVFLNQGSRAELLFLEWLDFIEESNNKLKWKNKNSVSLDAI